MQCQPFDKVRYQRAVKTITMIFVWLVCLLAVARSFAETPVQSTDDILTQARRYQFKFRAGDLSIIPAYVTMLEGATNAEQNNADLWYAMGVAYLAQAARALMPGGNPADAMPAIQKGPAALRRALQINPNHAEALAQLGGVQALMGSFMNAPAMAEKGVAAMNRAVELAPNSTRPHLQRAFSGLNLPDALRNPATEAEDLDFLVTLADGTRPGDYVRLMRGDLYFETGNAAAARDVYRIVERSSSPASADAKARVAAIDAGRGVAMSDIKALRNAAGAQCAMCHSR